MKDAVEEIKKRWNYDRFCKVPIEIVMPMIEADMEMPVKSVRREVCGQPAHVTSLRLRTFAIRGLVCVGCGLKAQFFALERTNVKKGKLSPYHLNLWGVKENGEEILFTHDHVLARSLGGLNHISNTQTMCSPCNALKSVEEGEKRRQQLRELNHDYGLSHTFS